MSLSKEQYEHILVALCNIEIILEEMQDQINTLDPTAKPQVVESTQQQQAVVNEIPERPNIKFVRLWKSYAEFRNSILSAFPAVKVAVENDAAAKSESYEFKKIAKQASCAWKLCKADKKNDSKLVAYVANEMKKAAYTKGYTI